MFADGQVCDYEHEVRPDPLHGRRHHSDHADFRNLQDDECGAYSCGSVQTLTIKQTIFARPVVGLTFNHAALSNLGSTCLRASFARANDLMIMVDIHKIF
jgi:hypothetical protein